ncbi:Flap-structured DNA-binding and RNA-binding protein [Malassezia nana]|uniref:RNA-binding protein VTS1 n=1 Tax=Malassezia nana TaxID=180528 RepID=A0AAF0J745_9BASI|nr:Flap-structured DNA-binding and RNA-binding protein [Malassezia nana]
MLPVGQQGTPETEVIDKWFEDLQNYEATLEEMAAASLDQNFKEELSAIEQWFRVLSEAERTAALYSLLQESTQVQIRFFITVLQQMARNDPVGAFISPNPTNNALGDQLEAKMAQLGIKSPTAMKSPSTNSRGFQRQSTGFLSPNAASLYGSGSPDVSAALAAQQNRLKANRTSAPGTLPMDALSYAGNTKLDNAHDKSPNTATPRDRPRSTDLSRSPRGSVPLDDALSPMSVGGSWASMVNTPIMSMLENNRSEQLGGDTAANLEATAAQLAQLQQMSGHVDGERVGRGGGLRGMYDQNWNSSATGLPQTPANVGTSAQFNSFNIPTMSPNTLAGLQSPSGGISNPTNLQMMNAMAAMGGLNNMNSSQLLALQQQILQQQQLQSLGQQGRVASRTNQRGTASAVGAGAARNAPQPGGHGLSSPSSGNSSLPAQQNPEEEVADISILNDVPSWLRHLRLHKYTPNFEGSNWREMVVMDEQALEEKGVAALGARRKMLKTFEAVRQKYGIEAPLSRNGANVGSDSKNSAAPEASTEQP